MQIILTKKKLLLQHALPHRRVITDFVVVCDETNNTPDIIDSNQFRADIFVKPARSINFIGLTFIATRTGVSFEEVVGNV